LCVCALIALPSSLLSPAPLRAFLALDLEPAAGSGCASISSAHDANATTRELSAVGTSAKVGRRAVFSTFFLGATEKSQCPVKMSFLDFLATLRLPATPKPSVHSSGLCIIASNSRAHILDVVVCASESGRLSVPTSASPAALLSRVPGGCPSFCPSSRGKSFISRFLFYRIIASCFR